MHTSLWATIASFAIKHALVEAYLGTVVSFHPFFYDV
jgi:hypothetical protein